MVENMEIVKYTQDKKNDWDKFINESKNGLFMFKRNYMDYHSDRFNDNSLMFYEKDKLIAVLPANVKDDTLYSHQGLTFGGFITDKKMKAYKMLNIFEDLSNYMREFNLRKFIYKAIPHIYHKYPSQEDLYALFRKNANLIKRDISSTIQISNRYAFNKGKKACVSKCKREGVTIEKTEDYSDFIDMLNTVLKDKYDTEATHSVNEIELLKNIFPDNISLFGAYKGNEMIAGTILFNYEYIVHTQYIATNELGRNLGAMDYIVSYLLEEFSGKKIYFDFGISTENDGKYLNEGLVAQKELLGARAICHDVYEIILD